MASTFHLPSAQRARRHKVVLRCKRGWEKEKRREKKRQEEKYFFLFLLLPLLCSIGFLFVLRWIGQNFKQALYSPTGRASLMVQACRSLSHSISQAVSQSSSGTWRTDRWQTCVWGGAAAVTLLASIETCVSFWHGWIAHSDKLGVKQAVLLLIFGRSSLFSHCTLCFATGLQAWSDEL